MLCIHITFYLTLTYTLIENINYNYIKEEDEDEDEKKNFSNCVNTMNCNNNVVYIHGSHLSFLITILCFLLNPLKIPFPLTRLSPQTIQPPFHLIA